ncbi:type 4a pilus biogenesis protein PilO [bacterium]|nr:type 4a pilus biogenesis protein PilO [bacterium]
MAIDTNMDVGALLKGLFSKKDPKEGEGAKSAPSPHTKTAMVIVLVLAAIGLYIYFVYLPTQAELKIKNEKISQIESLRYEIEELTNNIEVAEKELNIAQKEYERRTNLFHTDKELEDLYGQISLLAMSNKLTITKIEKGIERPVFTGNSCAANNDISNMDELGNMDDSEYVDENEYIDEEAIQLEKVGYYQFVVNLEILGNYNRFTDFRNGLAQLEKIINIDKEAIVVLRVDSEDSAAKAGDVKVTSVIATYRLPKNEEEKCANPDQQFEEEEF